MKGLKSFSLRWFGCIMKTAAGKYKWMVAGAGVALVLALGGLAAAFIPWKALLEDRIEGMLESGGTRNVELTVSGVGWKGIVLENVILGKDNPLTLGNVVVDYSMSGLRHKKLES